jgi:hypothetical protein
MVLLIRPLFIDKHLQVRGCRSVMPISTTRINVLELSARWLLRTMEERLKRFRRSYSDGGHQKLAKLKRSNRTDNEVSRL